jgi:GH25 family lysozyme M1 (1,4-beta-N-acetylmuramidase)
VEPNPTSWSFVRLWQGMKDCAILRGAYHFYSADHDPFKQAQNFLAALQGNPGDMPPMIDVEKGLVLKKRDCSKLLPNIVHFAETVERGTGMTPIVYASHGFWNSSFQCSDDPAGAAAISALAKYPLWVALYGDGPPLMFGGWTDWSIWQYSDKGKIGKGDLDLNRFAYGTPVLKAWLKALKKDPTVTAAQVAASMPPVDPSTGVAIPASGDGATAPAVPAVPAVPTAPAGLGGR